MQSSPSNDGKGTWECGIGETVPSCTTYGVADLLRCGEGRGMGFRLWIWSWSHGCWQGVVCGAGTAAAFTGCRSGRYWLGVCGAWRWAQVHPRERCERVPWCRSGKLELGCVNGGDLGGSSGDPARVAVVVRCNSGCTIAREEVVVLTQRGREEFVCAEANFVLHQHGSPIRVDSVCVGGESHGC